MTTVMFANNYDTAGARRGLLEGVYPDHHLFGMGAAPDGYSVVDLKVTDDFRTPWGDSRLQRDALSKGPGIVFAANAIPVRGLMAMRRSGLLRSSVVAVVHEVPGRGARPAVRRVHGSVLRGADHIISMCASTREGLIRDLGIDGARVSVGAWGPDSSFAPFLSAPTSIDGPVVSMGKSNRDLGTALKALGHLNRSAKVYVRDKTEHHRPPTVEFVDAVPPPREPHEPSSYNYVMDDLATASMVLIPLHAGATALQGLTELNDALACGKPVVMTRMPYLDLDIEAEGVGRWVEPGDWRGMAASIAEILEDRPLFEAMSARARELVSTRWNSRVFSDHVWDVMAGLAR